MTERPRRSGTSIAAVAIGLLALLAALLAWHAAASAQSRIDDLVRLLPLIGDRCCCGARTCSAAPVAPVSPPASLASAPPARAGQRAQAVPEPGALGLVAVAMVAAWAAKGRAQG